MVIRLVLERAIGEVAPVFLPMVQALQEMAGRYADDELMLIVNFYGQIEQIVREQLARLREAAPRTQPPRTQPPRTQPRHD